MQRDLLKIQQMVNRGEIPVAGLPIHLEPILVGALGVDHPAVREFMNRLELILFTIPTDKQIQESVALLQLVDESVKNRGGRDGAD